MGDYPLETLFLANRNFEGPGWFNNPHTQLNRERMERKVTFTSGTKRRRDSASAVVSSALSRRVTRLAKTLKASNPTHMYVFQATTAWASVSTTGSMQDLCGQISQGDDFTQRFGSHVDVTHVNIKLQFQPGTAATTPSDIRITLFVADTSSVFATNMTQTYSPIADNTIQRLLVDDFKQVANTQANQTFGCVYRRSLKLNHRQKFSGVGVNTTVANSLFLIVQSQHVAGTTAPIVSSGCVEVFFKP